MKLKQTAFLVVILLVALFATVGAQQGADWPQWRGPNRDGAVASFAAPASWPQQLTQKWKVDVGLGYATPLIVGNRLYLFSRQGDDEVMSALDPESGKAIWQTRYPVSFTMNSAAVRHGAGPKSTPVFANGRLYSIGMTGVVTAFDATSGRQLWQKPGGERSADVYQPRVFASRRSWPGHLSCGRAEPGRADGVRRDYRRCEVAVGRRRTRLRIADRR